MTARKYFSYTLLLFLAAFIILPTSKLVNSFYYLLIAAPALVYLVLNYKDVTLRTSVEYLFLLFISYCFLFGLINDPDFAKYSLYLLLFALVTSKIIDIRLFEGSRFTRALFWGLISYVLLSTAYFAFEGSYQLGVRITDLPTRLDGPIFTSILIASSLVLIAPTWIKERSTVEAIAGMLLALICVAVILQSRTGVVGLALWAVLMCVWLAWHYKGRGMLFALVATTIVFALVAFLLLESGKLLELFSRADSGRFEIWQFFISSWMECGLIRGCGTDFEMARPVNRQMILHPHSIFITLGVYQGLIALLLFVLLMAKVLWIAVSDRNWWGGYLAMALLLLNLDGSNVIDSPNELWLLIWLPAGFIVNRYLLTIKKNAVINQAIRGNQ